jgi:hypothetical protein
MFSVYTKTNLRIIAEENIDRDACSGFKETIMLDQLHFKTGQVTKILKFQVFLHKGIQLDIDFPLIKISIMFSAIQSLSDVI